MYETNGIPLPHWAPDSAYFTRAGRRRISAQPGAAVVLSDLSARSDVIVSYAAEGSPYAEKLKELAAYIEID